MAKKAWKKALIITLCTILGIFVILLTTPLLFKNQLMELAKTELNKMLLAKIDFKDLKLSFIRNFPSAYIALEGLEVTGIDNFEGELLAAFDSLNVTVNIMSVIRMKDIEIKSILLDRARLNGHILEDGRANWEIVKTDGEKEEAAIVEAEEKETAAFAFKVGLKRFEIRGMEITFTDEAHNMNAEAQTLNFILSGDMTSDNAELKMELAVDGIDFWLGGIRLANKVNIGFISEIAADIKNMFFKFKENRFNLNDIVLVFNGSAGVNDGDVNADITFASDRTDFKSLLSLVPAVYMNSFNTITTTGNLAISGDIKGTYSETTMPNANLSLAVDNAMFSYPDLPKSVERINIAVNAHYDGEVFDRSTVDVDRFNFEMAGNPFRAGLHVKTPESDMEVAAEFAGRIDFDSIADIIPLDDITLNGLLECDISIAGKMSMLENEQYEDFYAVGSLEISSFNFESEDFQQGVKITNTRLNFTPRIVELVNFDAVMGNSDVSMNGSLENFIPFIFKNETVSGTLSLRSNTIDLNEFTSGKSEEKEAAETEESEKESTQLNVIEVPKNIDFSLDVNIGSIFFDKLEITDTTGEMFVREGKLVMQNLEMNLLEGNMTLNGEYNTQDINVPFIDFEMNIRRFDITSALSSFSIMEKILPEPQNYTGKVSSALTLYSILDEHLSPVLDTVNSKGRLQTYNLQLHNSKLFGAMADLLKNESLRTPALDDVDIGFEIKDGRLWIEDPVVMRVPPARIELKGDQGLDMTLNYRVDAIMPVSVIGSGAANILSSIPGGSSLNEINIMGYMRGTVNDPDISLSIAETVNTITEAVREQVTEIVTQHIEEAVTQVNEEINRQIDQLLAEAQRQADNIRETAGQAADRVRREANAAADKLISDAEGKNMIERTLAQTAANALRNEGEANAARLEQEAENQAQAVMNEAQRRADELRR